MRNLKREKVLTLTEFKVTERTWVGGTGHGPSLEEKE